MGLVAVSDVQAWLDEKKLAIPANDPLVEEPIVRAMVLSQISTVFDTSTWIDTASTPSLVKVIIGGLVAAKRYNKIYSETEDAGNRYANKIENQLNVLLQQIVDGTVVLTDIETGVTPAQHSGHNPKFWPMDTTGAMQVFDARGKVIQPEGSQDILFRIGQQF